MADAATAVTVNGLSPARKGEYFHRALTVNNFSAAQYLQITTSPTQSNPLGDEAFLARDPEALGYDADGNLTSDGRWTYEWDGENRLRTLRSQVGSPAPERRIVYEYDYLGRRIRQTVWDDRDDGQGTEVSDVIYVYDRWNLIAELDANNSNARLRTCVWGLDLSGSRHGAGGVGGLLKITDYDGTPTHHWVSYDGNGNVLSLTSGTTASETARYEYGPFGEPIRGTGVMARKNPFRFSTKFTDNESGLVYYGYRYYNAVTGRWLNRDPAGELGGVNLYALSFNSPINCIDSDGRFVLSLTMLVVDASSAISNGLQGDYRAMSRDLAFTVLDAVSLAADVGSGGLGGTLIQGGRLALAGIALKNRAGLLAAALHLLPDKVDSRNLGSCPPSGSPSRTNWGPEHGTGNTEHNNWIEDILDRMKSLGAMDLRKNRVQRDVSGLRVFSPSGSYTKPDASYILEGMRYNHNRVSSLETLERELDAFRRMREADPNAINSLEF
ncbi:MAG TPA: RHS repeat-associated core domain-containing protein [Verrucomicrobiae bacterium]